MYQSAFSTPQKERDLYVPTTLSQEPKRIEKGSQYALMNDEWTVYIATAVSDSLIQLEKWGKNSSAELEPTVRYQVGIYKTDDEANGFQWVDDEHTAFVLRFNDEKDSDMKELKDRVFTININDSDAYKGTDYDPEIKCFSYENDRWHLYRAIPLSDDLIKIECWARSNAQNDYIYGWDWFVFNWDKDDIAFEWTDDVYDAFTCTLKDPQSPYYWEEDSFVLFMMEDPDYSYETVYDYLSK